MKGKLKLAIASLGLVVFASSGIGVGGLLESHVFEQPSVVQVEATSDPWADLDFYSYGAEFRDQLARLIEDTGDRTVSYSGSTDILRESDESPNHPGCITPFYHPDTDYLTDNYPNNWNKEHVWPNSRGAGKSGPGRLWLFLLFYHTPPGNATPVLLFFVFLIYCAAPLKAAGNSSGFPLAIRTRLWYHKYLRK